VFSGERGGKNPAVVENKRYKETTIHCPDRRHGPRGTLQTRPNVYRRRADAIQPNSKAFSGIRGIYANFAGN
jgi:hypothetical protein